MNDGIGCSCNINRPRMVIYLILKVCSYGLDHQLHPRAELRPRPLDRSRGGVFLHRKDIDPARAPFLLNCHLGEDIEMSWLFVDEFPKRCVHV
jgi:hypothetical protein